MSNCSVQGCKQTVISAFQEIIPATYEEMRGISVKGRTLTWCREHQSLLRPRTMNWNGYFLSAVQLNPDMTQVATGHEESTTSS